MIYSDTCGFVCVGIVYLSYFSISYFEVTFGFGQVYAEYSYLTSAIFGFVVFLSFFSHLAAMLLDPGTVTMESQPINATGLVCSQCQVIKIARTHHCTTCNKCILNMDHHCPWINNCVGFKNQKHFILFLVYTIISTAWGLVTVLQAAVFCVGNYCKMNKEPFWGLVVVVCCCFSVFFLLLCVVTLKDQFRVVVRNISEIDVLQLRSFKQRPLMENLEEVFGGGFGIGWFLPLPIKNKQKPVEVVSVIYSFGGVGGNLFDFSI